jgi:hypothetical protein
MFSQAAITATFLVRSEASLDAFVGVCIYFFIPLLILRFIKRGDGRPWDESCRMAFWVALAFVLIAIADQNRGTEIPLRCSIWSSRISEKIFCSLGKQNYGYRARYSLRRINVHRSQVFRISPSLSLCGSAHRRDCRRIGIGKRFGGEPMQDSRPVAETVNEGYYDFPTQAT